MALTPHPSGPTTPLQGLCTALGEPAQRSVTLDLWPHPLTAEGRETVALPLAAGATLGALLRAAMPVPPEAIAHAIEVRVDGDPVPAGAWDATPLRPGRIVAVRVAAGDSDEVNPWNIAATIALIAISIAIGGADGGTLGTTALELFGTTVTWGQIASAATLVGGSLLINHFLPHPGPPEPDSTAGERGFALAVGANRARPYEPMLLVLGTHRVFPDLGAQPYAEYAGRQQYLNQIFHFGLGDLTIGPVHVGETPLADFSGVQQEWSGADGSIDLVAGNVDTEAGVLLTESGWVRRTTPPNTRRFAVGIEFSIYRVNDKGQIAYIPVDFKVRYRPASSSDPWIERTWTLGATSTAKRPARSDLYFDVPAGQYDVDVRRVHTHSGDPRATVHVSYTALRSYQPDSADYAGQTRLGVPPPPPRLRSGRCPRVPARLPPRDHVWEGEAWGTARRESSNPAAVLRAFARGWHDAKGELLAGSGRRPAEIDDALLGRWYAWCEAHDPPLCCNLVLQGRHGPEEIEETIARCGRATISWQTGKLGVVWEDPATMPSSLITPARVLPGTMRSVWASGQLAEEVTVRYIDPDQDWQQREVRRTMPGVTAPAYSATLTARGVTSAKQAALFANLYAAGQFYRRRRLEWQASADALRIARGDVVHIAHDLVSGGITGRLKGGTAEEVTLDRAIDVDADTWLLIESPDGTLHQSAVGLPEDGESPSATVVLATPVPAAAGTPGVAVDGAGARDWIWRRYGVSAPPLPVRIVEVVPVDEKQIRLAAVDESPLYHAAATADLSVPLTPARVRTVQVVSLTVSEILVRAGNSLVVELEASATVAGDWRGGEILALRPGGAHRRVGTMTEGETTARWIEEPAGTVTVTVVPGSAAAPAGQPVSVTHEIVGLLAPPPPPADFRIEVLADGTRRWSWTPPGVADLAGIQIRYAAGSDTTVAWDDMTPLHKGVWTASPLELNEPAQGEWVFATRAVDTSGTLSDGDVRIVAALGPARTGDTLLWRCPTGDGWRGTIEGGVEASDAPDGRNALEGEGNYTWADLTTWDAWTSWALGDGDDGATAMTYTTRAEDLGATLPFSLRWAGKTAGSVQLETRVAASENALAMAAWKTYAVGQVLTGRWVQLRWRLTGDGSTALSLDDLCWSAHSPTHQVRHLDADTSAWSGSAAAGRGIPAGDLALVTQVEVTLQNVGAGASWEVLSKNPPRIRIWDGAGTAIDATVDVILRGVRN